MRRRRIFCVALLALAALPHRAGAQYIAVSETANGGSCYLPPLTGPGTATVYILMHLSSSLPGITGAEFRVTGLPPGVLATATANPAAALTLGNPFDAGCNIAFAKCESGNNNIVVLLYTVNMLVTSDTPQYTLRVEQHSVPTGPDFQCPLITLCDAPVFTKVCVSGGQSSPGPVLAIPSSPTPANGAVAVPVGVTLEWGHAGRNHCCGIGLPLTNVYFGTTSPAPFAHHYPDGVRSHDPGPLAPLTTYYWRIASTPDHDCGVVAGPEWSFTTGQLVAVDASTWQAVKDMFR